MATDGLPCLGHARQGRTQPYPSHPLLESTPRVRRASSFSALGGSDTSVLQILPTDQAHSCVWVRLPLLGPLFPWLLSDPHLALNLQAEFSWKPWPTPGTGFHGSVYQNCHLQLVFHVRCDQHFSHCHVPVNPVGAHVKMQVQVQQVRGRA